MEDDYNHLNFVSSKQDASEGVYESSMSQPTQQDIASFSANADQNWAGSSKSANKISDCDMTESKKKDWPNSFCTKLMIFLIAVFLIAAVGLILGIFSFIQREQGIPEDNGERLRQLESVVERLRQLERELEELKSSNVNLPKSCDYINGTSNQSGLYLISPGSPLVPSFYVYCNFTGTTTETTISHDSMQEIEVGKCAAPRCYKHTITYEASLRQTIALIDQSQTCRQFIKYRCIRSLIFGPRIPTYASWLSRDRTEKIYWGGASPRRQHYCACGEAGNCMNGLNCNCDSNSRTETSDEGYLTDRDSLPVTELQFGDTDDSNEHGWHTLGPLICSGRNNQ